MQYCIKVRQTNYPYAVCDYVPPDEASVFITDDEWIAQDLAITLGSQDSTNEYFRQPFFPEGDESWRDRERKRLQHAQKHGTMTRLYIMDLLRERCPDIAAAIPEWCCPWVDVARSDGTPYVFYFKDLSFCREDNSTHARLGRFLNKTCEDAGITTLRESEIDEICAQITIHGCRIELLSDAEEIERMYLFSDDCGFGACMSHERGEYAFSCEHDLHPVHAYADSPNLRIAALYRGNRLIARTVVWPDKQIYGKIYGDHYRMRAVLVNEGYRLYSDSESFEGGKLAYIVLEEDDNGEPTKVLCPYLDIAEFVRYENGSLVICGPDETGWPDNDADPPVFQAKGTDGAARRTASCSNCNEHHYPPGGQYMDCAHVMRNVDGQYYCSYCYEQKYFECRICHDEIEVTDSARRANSSIGHYWEYDNDSRLRHYQHAANQVCNNCVVDHVQCSNCDDGVHKDAMCPDVMDASGGIGSVCSGCLRRSANYVLLNTQQGERWLHIQGPNVGWDSSNFRWRYVDTD